MDLFSNGNATMDVAAAVRLLNESTTAFLTLFNNSPICMSMTTTTLGSRTYVKVNKKFVEIFGFSEEEILGRTSVEVGILSHQESIRVGEVLKEKEKLQNDYVQCISKKGEIVHTLSSIESMEMNGTPYLVAFFVNISKIVEQQSIIEQHAQQLEAVNKELEAFSYSVSHDLRAPLRAIDGFTKSIEDDYRSLFDEDGLKLLGSVRRNAHKMSQLIDDLLSFARLGKQEVNKAEIDMNILIGEVLADLKRENPHGAQVKIGTLHSIQGDYALIRQVVFNLVSNAIKYSSKTDKPVVEINSRIEPGYVVYTVKDNGAGFDMKYVDKLFGVFQRLHSPKQFEGTGVGLANVQRILSKHNGSIAAVAEVDKGAEFTFKLPS